MFFWFIALFASLVLKVTPSYGTKLSARQATVGCDTFCTPVGSVDLVDLTDFTALSCTNCLIQQLAACMDCEDGDGQDTQDSQETISTFVSGCNAAGSSVHDVTVNGSFTASGGPVFNPNDPNSSFPTAPLQTNPYSCAPTPTATASVGSSSSGQKKTNGSKGKRARRDMLFMGVLGAFLLSVV
ncbi:hypothetical protein C8R44DRAFT_876508 [Mycena epipterygia]|nr:hypothetical protein C8R44DRAFT_876508 [Mycena epipterygia]